MHIRSSFVLLFLFLHGFVAGVAAQTASSESRDSLFCQIDFLDQPLPERALFERALSGFHHINAQHDLSKKKIITLIDFRISANQKRLWTIDLERKKLLYHTWVAHGRNSGEEFATRFSNTPESHQSSLGFYLTGNTYIGKHGLSLKLYGIEPGINDKAEARAIVMHGAPYVSAAFINSAGRLGRSYGCPAIPAEISDDMVKALAGHSVLYIYYPDAYYLAKTTFRTQENQVIAAAGQ